VTYVLDALLVSTLALVGWRAMRRGGRWADALWIGWLVAIIGGVRPQTVPGLGLLLLYVFWQFDQQRVAKLLLAAAVAVGVGLLWFVPMVQASGGLAVYLSIVRLHAANNAPVTWLGGGGWDALVQNLSRIIVYLAQGLGLAGAVLLSGMVYRAFRMSPADRQVWKNEHGRAGAMLGCWVGWMVFLGGVIGFTSQPGYVLAYLPALLVLTGAAVGSLRARGWPVGVAAAMVVVNGALFLGPARPGMTLTAGAIRAHDEMMADVIRTIRERFDPQTTVICHVDSWFALGLRHLQVHLREYDQYQLIADPTVLGEGDRHHWQSRHGRLAYVNDIDRAGKTTALFLAPPGVDLSPGQRWLPVDDWKLVKEMAGVRLYAVDVHKARLQAVKSD
jgi:hypothetical protein